MRVVFLGTPDFAVPTLKKLIAETTVVAVYSQPDRPVGRGLKMRASPVKQVALENLIPVFTPEKISVPEEIERLKSFSPDFIVVVAYGQILKLPVIEAPKYATVNIHSSLLPRWRGAAPIHWAVLSGDLETGISTMRIVPKLDAGDVYLQEKIKISEEDTTETVHDRLSEIGANLIIPTLIGIRDNTITRTVQDETQVTYAHKLTKEMENLSAGDTAKTVDLKVRALNPWPGIKIELKNGLRMKVIKGRILNGMARLQAGELSTSGGELVLGCAEGTYQLLEVQEEGKKPIAGSDYLNGLQNRKIDLPQNLVFHDLGGTSS